MTIDIQGEVISNRGIETPVLTALLLHLEFQIHSNGSPLVFLHFPFPNKTYRNYTSAPSVSPMFRPLIIYSTVIPKIILSCLRMEQISLPIK